MKVAFVGSQYTSESLMRGIGVQTTELVKSLEKLEGKDFVFDVIDNLTADLSKYDLVHYSYFHPYFLTLPSERRARKVLVTIDDLIPLIYSKAYPGGVVGTLNLLKQKLRLGNVDGVLTISETSKKDIVRLLNVAHKKIYVTHLAPKSIFRKLNYSSCLDIKTKYGLPDKFVLYVGDVNYNKNVINLIKACNYAGLNLVLVGKHAKEIESNLNSGSFNGPKDWLRYLIGKPHPEIAHYEELINEIDKAKRLMFRLGFVPDEDLVKLYNVATVYCQPSFYEGFGLPIVEAMACGTPVLASKIQTLVEVAEGGAKFVDPTNFKIMGDKLKEIIASLNLRKKLSLNGKKIVKNYSWDITARKTLEVYKNVVGS